MVDVVDSKSTASDGVPVRVRSPAPRRSKLCIACSDFFQKSERTYSAAPPFQSRPACAGLASDDENASDLNCLTAPTKRGGIGLLYFVDIVPDSNPSRCKAPVGPCLAPSRHNPNQVSQVGDGFGFFPFFGKCGDRCFSPG